MTHAFNYQNYKNMLKSISRIEGESIQVINLNALSIQLKQWEIKLQKQKNRDLEAGLSMSNFGVEKNKIFLLIFVLRLDDAEYTMTAYHDGKFVEEVEFEQEHNLASLINRVFESLKNKVFRQATLNSSLYESIDELYNAGGKVSKESKGNSHVAIQEFKTTPEYQKILRLEIDLHNSIMEESKALQVKQKKVGEKANKLVETLIQVEHSKQELYYNVHAYYDIKEKSQNPDTFLAPIINRKQKDIEARPIASITDANFDQVLYQLIEYKKIELLHTILTK